MNTNRIKAGSKYRSTTRMADGSYPVVTVERVERFTVFTVGPRCPIMAGPEHLFAATHEPV